LLAESLPAVEAELQSPSSTWLRRATLELMHSEAQALIGPTEADKAVENENPHRDDDERRNLTPDT
jgi:hypothetical protein